jgi:superfamily II DNA helicase RecQ
MGYLYQQVCSIFKFESFNPYQKKAFLSIVNEKKDFFVNLTTGAGNYLFIRQLPKLFDVIFGFEYLNKL